MRTCIRQKTFFTALFTGFLAMAVHAETVTEPGTASKDAQVLSKIHHVNELEVKLGKLAIKKAVTSDVKKYGTMLLGDHTTADMKVKKLAKTKGIVLTEPATTTEQERAEAQEEAKLEESLRAATGMDFDHSFLTAMKKRPPG